MLSIIQLLADPNPSDPINPEAARMLQQYPEDYHRMVRSMIDEQEGGDGEAGQEGQQGADDLDADVAEEDEADEEENNVDPWW